MTDTLPVTLVTKDASRDALSDADYIAIIDSLRGPLYGWSWQRIADETGYNSKAWWALVNKGTRQLNDEARNALRRVTDGELPEQPPSVMAVTERMVHPDAEMLLIGALEPGERVRRVLMLAASDVAVYINGDVHAEPLQAATTGAGVSECHNDTLHAVTDARGSVAANRAPCYRPKFSVEDRERFEALGGLRKIIDAGLQALAMEDGRRWTICQSDCGQDTAFLSTNACGGTKMDTDTPPSTSAPTLPRHSWTPPTSALPNLKRSIGGLVLTNGCRMTGGRR